MNYKEAWNADYTDTTLPTLPTEDKMHDQMPCKLSCCRNNNIIDDPNTYLSSTAPTVATTLSDDNSQWETLPEIPDINEDNPLPDLAVNTLLLCKRIQNKTYIRILNVLLDTGSTRTMINSTALPKGSTPIVLRDGIKSQTIAGNFGSRRQVTLDSITLPEFDKGNKIKQQTALVFDATCKYDIILGRDFLNKAGIIIDFADKKIKWYGKELPLREPYNKWT